MSSHGLVHRRWPTSQYLYKMKILWSLSFLILMNMKKLNGDCINAHNKQRIAMARIPNPNVRCRRRAVCLNHFLGYEPNTTIPHLRRLRRIRQKMRIIKVMKLVKSNYKHNYVNALQVSSECIKNLNPELI